MAMVAVAVGVAALLHVLLALHMVVVSGNGWGLPLGQLFLAHHHLDLVAYASDLVQWLHKRVLPMPVQTTSLSISCCEKWGAGSFSAPDSVRGRKCSR